MKYQRLAVDLSKSIATIRLEAGDGNLVDRRLLNELTEAAAGLSDHASVRVLVLSAQEPDFCRGWHDSLKDETSPEAETLAVDPFGPVAALTCPVLVAIQGSASSAGLELALTGDIRLAAANSSFSMPDLASGRVPRAGGSQRLPRVIGQGRALAMLLTGDEMSADEALSAGLVTAVVPADQLQAETAKMAETLAAAGPLATRLAKESTRRGLDMGLADGLRLENDLALLLQSTQDRAEGLRAFLEKRSPHFDGR